MERKSFSWSKKDGEIYTNFRVLFGIKNKEVVDELLVVMLLIRPDVGCVSPIFVQLQLRNKKNVIDICSFKRVVVIAVFAEREDAFVDRRLAKQSWDVCQWVIGVWM